MSLIQVRNVPEDIHRRLKERATREGVTLSELAMTELRRSLQRLTRGEVLARIAASQPDEYGGETAAESVRA